MSEYFCRICDRSFETIPNGSIEIGRPHGFRHQYQMMRFPDGSVHDLKKLVEPPEPATDLLKAMAQALSELPTPEPEPETAMAVAIRNFKNK